MTGSTISTRISNTVTIGSTNYAPPLTVDPTGVVAPTATGATGIFDAVAGAAITNLGIVAGGPGVDNTALRGGGGVGGYGIELTTSGTIDNDGSIGGGVGGNGFIAGPGGGGVYIAGGTLSNSGTISSGAPGSGEITLSVAVDAVQFGSLAGTLVIAPGAVFNGAVAGNSSSDSIVLGYGLGAPAGGGSPGTLAGLGTQFTGFSTVSVVHDGTWTIESGVATVDSTAFVDLSATDTLVLSGGGTLTNKLLGLGGLALSDGHFTLDPKGGAFGAGIVLTGADLTVAAGVSDTPTTYGMDAAAVATAQTLVNAGTLYGAGGAYVATTGTVAGNGGGGVVFAAAGTITNTGTISGGFGGSGGGASSNTAGIGGIGVVLGEGGAGSNSGLIRGGGGGGALRTAGAGAAGVLLGGGAQFANAGIILGGDGGTGVVNGGAGGAGVSIGGGASLINTGVIAGGGGRPADLTSGSPGAGVVIDSGTFTNDGTVTGGNYNSINGARSGADSINGARSGADAVRFDGAGTLAVGAGAVFQGFVVGDAATVDVLELTAGAAGTLAGLGTAFNGFASLTVAADANWTLAGSPVFAGAVAIDPGSGGTVTTLSIGGDGVGLTGVITDRGVLRFDGTGSTRFAGTLNGDGNVSVVAGTVAFAGSTSGPTFVLGGGTAVEAASGAFGGDPLAFAQQADSTLRIDAGLGLSSTIAGFGAGDRIDLAGFQSSSITFTPDSGHVLQVTDGAGHAIALAFAAGNDIANAVFQASSDGAGGAFVTETSQAPCYCRGTRILTPAGEVAVEDLRIGDHVVTHGGLARPVRWIGRRAYAGRFLAGNTAVLPILIRAGALGGDVPRRDLMVSPQHALYLEGVLIPAVALVNGDGIAQCTDVAEVAYFHIELETHDVIFAEGAAAETFIDDGSRLMFANAAEFGRLYPGAARAATPRSCAPRVEHGEAVEAVRRHLAGPAGGQQGGALQGWLDRADREWICGWAFDPEHPASRVRLRVLDGDAALAEITADGFRDDLLAAGIGDGGHAFAWAVPGGLSPFRRHDIRVVRATDGSTLPGVPACVEKLPLPLLLPAAPGAAVLQGCVDVGTRGEIAGWVRDPETPDRAIAVQVIDNGAVIGRVLANLPRPDLAAAGIGGGRHGFRVVIPGGLSPQTRHVVELRREADGAPVPGSPVVLAAAEGLDDDLRQCLDRALEAEEAGGADALPFLLGQVDRLLQRRAQSGGRAGRLALDQFQARWGAAAGAPREAGRTRALFIDDSWPDADRDAGSQAVCSHMRAAMALGYEVCFVAADGFGLPARPLGLPAGAIALGAPLYASVEDVLRRQAGAFDLVYVHRVAVAERYLALARHHLPRAVHVFAVADLAHLRLARQAAVTAEQACSARAARLRVAELSAAWAADVTITHSAVEAAMLRRAVPGARVAVVPWAVPVAPVDMPFAQRQGVGFLGWFGHAPNADAAHFLVAQVMALVWQAAPVRCVLAGADMPASVRALAGERVLVLGHVASPAELFAQVRLTVAPLRYGAGVKGKVLASLGAGLACAMTPVAAEGLDLPQALRHVAEDAPALARLILRLHATEEAEGAVDFVQASWSDASVAQAFAQALGAPALRLAV